MTNPAKSKGTRLETAVAKYMQWALNDERIHRNPPSGAKDKGDIGGIMFNGQPVTVEVKNTSRPQLSEHLTEAETEAGNNDSPYPILIWKRRGMGISTLNGVGQQYAVMTLETLCRLLNHGIPLGGEKTGGAQ